MKVLTLSTFSQIALWLAIIGAINWGLTALGFNLVEAITGDAEWLARTIYLIVGLSGLYLAIRAAMRERATDTEFHPRT